jgi:hypothetical protein
MLDQLNRPFHAFNDLRNYQVRITLKDHSVLTGFLVAVSVQEENNAWIYPRDPEKQFVICSVKMKSELEKCLYNLKTLPSNIRVVDHEQILKMEVLLPGAGN